MGSTCIRNSKDVTFARKVQKTKKETKEVIEVTEESEEFEVSSLNELSSLISSWLTVKLYYKLSRRLEDMTKSLDTKAKIIEVATEHLQTKDTMGFQLETSQKS